MLSVEWRTSSDGDTILVVEDATVRRSMIVDADLLSRFLTDQNDLSSWQGGVGSGQGGDPRSWGRLVISRATTGEVITMDPELYWNGIYQWFRSRGVDYDTYGARPVR